MPRIKTITAEYYGFHTDYDDTTYYPNGLIDEEEGIEAVLVLTDKGGWTINFTQNGDEYNFTNVLEILQKSDFSAIAGPEPEMEVGDSTGIDGQLHLNGEIHESDEEHIIIKGASKIIDNDWDKIGERDTFEVVVSSGRSPYVEIIFEDESRKSFDSDEINDAVVFIKNNFPGPESNREMIMAAIVNDGLALSYASDELKADKEVVMAAVENDGDALDFASDELKADKEVVMAALSNGARFIYVSDEMKADKEVVMAAVENDGDALDSASDDLKKDKEVVMAAVLQDGNSLQYASEELRANKEIVLAALQEDGMYYFECVAEKLRSDKEVALAAVKSYRGSLTELSAELQADPDILKLIDD